MVDELLGVAVVVGYLAVVGVVALLVVALARSAAPRAYGERRRGRRAGDPRRSPGLRS